MKIARRNLAIAVVILIFGFVAISAYGQASSVGAATAAKAQRANPQNSPADPLSPGTKANNAQNLAPSDEDACAKNDVDKYTDCRGVFGSSFYIGLAIDTFAGDDTLKYLNPGDSGKTHERAIGGIDFAYRLFGDHMPLLKFQDLAANHNGTPCDPSKGDLCRSVDWHPRNVWVYGETVHGVRSVDIDCTKNADLPVCTKNLIEPSNPGEQIYYILRNASSLEGFMGLRWEFLGLQQRSHTPANLYFKAQMGFLTVAGAPGTALDLAHIALGAIATKGPYSNSYLEVGFGRSDMFSTARRKRVKIDGYLQRQLAPDNKGVVSAVSLFTQLTVDTDLGRGSDAIQTFIGLNFDLGKLHGTKAPQVTRSGTGGEK